MLLICITVGRVLRGAFLCTDRDANVILCSCTEYLSTEHTEARVLGLVKVPDQHIVSILYKKNTIMLITILDYFYHHITNTKASILLYCLKFYVDQCNLYTRSQPTM